VHDGGRPAGADRAARPHDREQWSTEVAGARALAASPDGRLVAVGLVSGAIEIRHADSGILVTSLPGRDSPIVALTFGGDDRIVAAWDDGRVAALGWR